MIFRIFSSEICRFPSPGGRTKQPEPFSHLFGTGETEKIRPEYLSRARVIFGRSVARGRQLRRTGWIRTTAKG
ncbi:Uncharacterized protein dnm_035890 [Desulfonema magnum]|uniref:Uncharacterized protein n=1 Tax=Desulfonema magnum TaxID=45655 RepID=A0A975GNA1_9BACT|nr:Uncharacterized protein dnm_035890 [Desulfonema magnum]